MAPLLPAGGGRGMALGWGQLSRGLAPRLLLGQLLARGSRGMLGTGKGQLVPSGDAGLGIWKCGRFPAVLLASASPRNKIELITTLL